MLAANEQELRMRQRRHEQLMRMISQYHLSEEETDYLETIARNTRSEIASRFAACKHNKSYRFPKTLDEDQAEQWSKGLQFSFERTTEDLRTQNQVKHQEIKKKEVQPSVARRVKSLGSEKLTDRILKDMSKGLRERPQEREGQRDKIIFPELHRNVHSQKILLQLDQKSKSGQSSHRSLKIRPIYQARQMISKQKRQKKLAEFLMAPKLLTEGGQHLSFGKAKVLINKLRAVSPAKRILRPKKLITE